MMTSHFALTRPALASYSVLASNTAAVNSANLARLEADLAGQAIDMLGATIPVTAIPAGARYYNGFWRVADALGVQVSVPARGTISARQARASTGAGYRAWPQGNAHAYRASIWQPFTAGTSHNADLEVRIGRSDDNGLSWTNETPTLPTVVDFPNRIVFSSGVIRGQQFMVVRYGNAANTTFRHKLLARRLYERTQKTAVTITPGAGTWVLSPTTDWGLKPGDTFSIHAWTGAATVGGAPVNTTPLTVTAVTDNSVTVTRAGSSATTAEIGDLIFEPVQGAFAEVTFGAGALEFGDAVLTAAGLTPGTDQPATLFHDFAPRDDLARGGFYVGLHGGGHGGGAKLALVQGVLGSNAALRVVSWVRVIAAEGVEPTVTWTGTHLIGGVRSQSFTGYPARVWRSADELATAPVLIDAPNNANWARRQPVAIRVAGGQVFLFFAGERGNTQGPKPIPLYLATVPLAQFLAATVWPFQIIRLGAAYLSSTNNIPETNAVGLCSMAALSNAKMFLAWSTEHAPKDFDQDGQPAVWGAVLDVSRWTGAPVPTDEIGYLAVE
jgi:hypothetical protein